MKIHTVASNWSRIKVKYKVNIVNATKNNDKRESRNKEAAKNKTERKKEQNTKTKGNVRPSHGCRFIPFTSFLPRSVCVCVELKIEKLATWDTKILTLEFNIVFYVRVPCVSGWWCTITDCRTATALFFLFFYFFANSPNIQYLPPVSCYVSHRFSIFRKIYGDYSSNKSNKQKLRSFFFANE